MSKEMEELKSSAVQQVLDLIMEECRYWHGRDETRRGGYAILYAKAVEVVDRQQAPAEHAAEPAGWVTEDYRTDKSATTYDPVVAERWKAKGWPVWNLYAAPADQSVRIAELEQSLELFAKRAISICGGEASEWDSGDVILYKNYAQACENRIRRLRDEFRAALAKHGEAGK